MKRLIHIAILTIAFCLSANAQTVTIEQKTADLAAKCFTESPLKDKVIETQTAEITALKNEIRASENQTAAAQQIIKLQGEMLDVFRRLKCSKTSFLFGLISKKTCY